jgi:hypothetical protein
MKFSNEPKEKYDYHESFAPKKPLYRSPDIASFEGRTGVLYEVWV